MGADDGKFVLKPFFVYLLRCADDSYYCGHTDNIECRLAQHHDGGIGYTATRKPLELAWQGEFLTREEALAFERQVKGWTRAKKTALINGDWETIKVLAKCRSSEKEPFDKLRANGGGGAGLEVREGDILAINTQTPFALSLSKGSGCEVSCSGLGVNGAGR